MSTEYQTVFNNSVQVVETSLLDTPSMNNAALQTNILGVSTKAYINDLDVVGTSNLNSINASSLTSTAITASALNASSVTASGLVSAGSITSSGINVTGTSTLATANVTTLNATNSSLGTATASSVTASGLVTAGSIATAGSLNADSTTLGATTVTSLVVLNNIQINGTLSSNSILSSNVDIIKQVMMDTTCTDVSTATTLVFDANLCYGTFFIMIDESNSGYVNSKTDGAAAIFASCTNSSTSKINILSSINGTTSGNIRALWVTPDSTGADANKMYLKLWRSAGSSVTYYLVRILSPTKISVV